jgi:hypothetical protein
LAFKDESLPRVCSLKCDSNDIKGIIQGLEKFFAEPDGLPAHCTHDCSESFVEGLAGYKNRPYWVLNEEEDLMLREYLQEKLRNGHIVPLSLPVSSPMLFVRKKDGALLLCFF